MKTATVATVAAATTVATADRPAWAIVKDALVEALTALAELRRLDLFAYPTAMCDAVEMAGFEVVEGWHYPSEDSDYNDDNYGEDQQCLTISSGASRYQVFLPWGWSTPWVERLA